MSTWKRRDDWVGTQVDDQFVMINVESGRYVALNDTAAEVWRLIEQPRDEPALVSAMLATFDVDRDACARSVSEAMARMQALGMAEPLA